MVNNQHQSRRRGVGNELYNGPRCNNPVAYNTPVCTQESCRKKPGSIEGIKKGSLPINWSVSHCTHACSLFFFHEVTVGDSSQASCLSMCDPATATAPPTLLRGALTCSFVRCLCCVYPILLALQPVSDSLLVLNPHKSDIPKRPNECLARFNCLQPPPPRRPSDPPKPGRLAPGRSASAWTQAGRPGAVAAGSREAQSWPRLE